MVAGYDPDDLTSVDLPIGDYLAGSLESAKPLRVGIPRSYFYDDLDSEVGAAIEGALRVVETLVGTIKDVQLDVPTDRSLQSAESYAVHAAGLSKMPELYQPETLRRLKSGANVSVADYLQRHRELAHARRSIGAVFAHLDLLVTPTIPMAAPGIAELKANPEALRPAELRLLRNTRPFNVWGLPAISLTCGFTKEGLPIGLQIAGPHWREDLVLRLAHAYEQATEWHTQRPRILSD
jgi:Asp-tRNA(Asn)/Glu-tRNA(Gln) amidotransferase A subunit family amidase